MHYEDLVIGRPVIQSVKAKDKIAQLGYLVRGSFQIVRSVGPESYIVRKMNRADSPELKFISENLYILPPFFKPCEPIDSYDTRYLNQFHAHIVSPL